MTEENEEKKSFAQRFMQDKVGIKITAIGIAFGAVVLGYSHFESGHVHNEQVKSDEESSTRQVASIKESGRRKSMTPEDARLSHEQTRLEVKNAMSTGGSETPPVLPPIDTAQALPAHLPSDKDETPSEDPSKAKLPEMPMPDESPGVPMQKKNLASNANVQIKHQLDPDLLKAYEHQASLLQKSKFPSITTVSFEDHHSDGSSGSKGGISGKEGTTTSSGRGVGDGHYLDLNGRWHDEQGSDPWAEGHSKSLADHPSNGNGQTDNPNSDNSTEFELPAPGTMVYAVLLGAVNSDTPGVVIGEIRQGAFNGSRILGSFDFTREGVMIKFKTMTVPYTNENGVKKAKPISINAVALNEKDLSPAMATSIDRHMLETFAVSFASGFLQGLGQAAESSGSTATYGVGGTTLSNAKLSTTDQLLYGFGQGANQLSSQFQSKYGNLRDTIKVKSQTPFALLFLGGDQ